MKLRKTIAGATLAIAFVINPACYELVTQAPQFQYGEREMRGAVEGSWELTYTATGETIRFSIAQSSRAEMALAPRGGLVSSASACGTRSLIRTAGACEDISLMPLDLVATGHHFEKAHFRIFGTDWDQYKDPEMVELAFTIDGIAVHASIDRDGHTPYAWADEPRKPIDNRNVSVRLKRIAR